MKTKFLRITAAIVLSAGSIASCKKTENNDLSSDTRTRLQAGGWRVTNFVDNGNNETAHFTGYTFTFSNGTVTAVNGSNTVSGSWGTRYDDNVTKVDIAFASPANFVDLNDDWHVAESTDTRMRLQDVSGGNGGTDYLTLERN